MNRKTIMKGEVQKLRVELELGPPLDDYILEVVIAISGGRYS